MATDEHWFILLRAVVYCTRTHSCVCTVLHCTAARHGARGTGARTARRVGAGASRAATVAGRVALSDGAATRAARGTAQTRGARLRLFIQ